MPESTNTAGRKPRVTDEDFLDVFRSTADPVLSTAEVADAVPIKRRGTLNRLRRLEEDGQLASKRIGGRNTVWWLRDDTPAESSRESGVTPSPAPAGRSGSTPTDGQEDAPGDDEDPVDALDTTDDRRAAVRACIDYLRDHGTGQKSDFVDNVYPEYPGGFGSPGGWWNKIGKEFLQTVAQDVHALTPPATEGGHTWRWDAENPRPAGRRG